MRREAVTDAIVLARFATSSYDISENGAASPGRWHVTQLSKTIGAMVSLNVTAGRGGVAAAVSQAARPTMAIERSVSARSVRLMTRVLQQRLPSYCR
jgi:hypothetical protein